MTIFVGVSSSEFIPQVASGLLSLVSGASGDVITLTPPSGKRVRLNLLYANTDETGVTITAGSDTVITSLTIGANNAALSTGEFRIGDIPAPTDSSLGRGSSMPSIITTNSDETIVITKDTGSTVATIFYSFDTGN